jgi:hypothetical protein
MLMHVTRLSIKIYDMTHNQGIIFECIKNLTKNNTCETYLS